MQEQNNNSDKITFKVKFLGEYHDMVIDWNDDKYEYEQQQVFEQLASITGIPSKYKGRFDLFETLPVDPDVNDGYISSLVSFYNSIFFPPGLERNRRYDFSKERIHDKCIRDGERFHLKFYPFYEINRMKRIAINYYILTEDRLTEGACSDLVCQHTNTESFFNKIKDLVTNDELNSQISHRVQPIMESNAGHWHARHLEETKIFREFNVKQYLDATCSLLHRERIQEGDGRQEYLYLRTRG